MMHRGTALRMVLVLSLLAYNPIVTFAQTDSSDSVQAPQVLEQQSNVINTEIDELKAPETILQELLAANQIPENLAPTIKVINAGSLNASTNGSEIRINSALLDRLTSNDERAFVISHELAHVVLHHIALT